MTLSVRVYAQDAEASVHHLRTSEGRHEIDLIVQRADQRVVALEVKLAASVVESDVRHLLWLQDQIGSNVLDAAVITTGAHAYPSPGRYRGHSSRTAGPLRLDAWRTA